MSELYKVNAEIEVDNYRELTSPQIGERIRQAIGDSLGAWISTSYIEVNKCDK